jgi:hypothetical protein
LLLAAEWQLKGVIWNVDKGRCPLCLGEEDAKHVLFDCKETNHWRLNLIRDKWLKVNKEVAYRKMVKITKATHIQNLGRYLDIVKNKCLNKINLTI